MAEMLDIYDENLESIGVKERTAVHLDGDWHRTFHCWIVSQGDDGTRYLLFQLRGPDKAVFPNMLDITSAGHLEHGEDMRDGVRELREELGVSSDYDELVYLGLRTEVAKIGNIVNREFCDVYFLRDDRAIEDFDLEPDEVPGLVALELQDGLRLFAGEVTEIVVRSVTAGGQMNRRTITLDDVIPRFDPYYLKMCIMAERFLDGEPYLAV